MSKILILFLVTYSVLIAEVEEFPFIGVAISSESADILTTTNDIDKHKNTNIGIRYGQQTVDWRSMITYARSSKQKILSAEIDKILLDELFGTSTIRPYIGGVLGMAKFNELDLISDTSYFYGFNLGLIIYATDDIDADIAYHYYETFDDDEIANMQGATLSLHYFY